MSDPSTGLREFMIAELAAAYEEQIRRNTPWGLFWPEEHARICKAAERVTRQQRRYAERQAKRKPLCRSTPNTSS